MNLSRRQLMLGVGITGCSALAGSLLQKIVAGGGLYRKALRPPGAGTEQKFLSLCIRCAQCVQVCPSDSIDVLGLSAGLAMGTPFVPSRTNPCRLCSNEDSLLCVEICPTGALHGATTPEEVAMGVAVIYEDHCLAYNQQICRACHHACPFPDKAIILDERNRPQIVADECVGCGICDWACLTTPSSIEMVPA